ncbi:MAG: bidirectional hydrogenase complex protein HoxE [Phycisphaerales bacterium]
MPAILKPKIDMPSDDKRWRIVDGTARRNGLNRHALIETLHTVQEAFGYIDDDALRFVAKRLRVPLSSAYGVATFYHFFTLKPQGKHTCVVCRGTACYIKGAPKLIDTIENKLDIKPGETTEDGEVSLLSARCVGSCGLAPAVVFDGEVSGKVTPETMTQKLDKWVNHDA